VETVFVIVVASVLLQAGAPGPRHSLDEPRCGPAPAVAAGFGAVVTMLLLVATSRPEFDTALPQFFAERSVPDAYGRNVVNVILVDFRALDTLGEITVVLLSLLAALPLLQALLRRAPARGGPGNTQR
jgi:multicomponent Na+:H+ antiporter subunit A